jgi:NurA-like 5'-3' nuclease
VAQYKISGKVTSTNVETVRKLINQVLPNNQLLVEKVENQSRQARLDEAIGWIDDAKNVIDELRGEMEEWYDSIPENLRGGQKADDVDECKRALEEIYEALDNIDSSAVSFPAMM